MNMINTNGEKETSTTHSTYLTLRDMILTGALPAGQKIKIETLRKKLDTGASPIREALSLLTSDLLVERLDQRGFRAAPASTENFAEILKLRCTLEDLALRQSIEKVNQEWEERLVLSHHRVKRAANSEAFEEAHKSFHMTLVSNAASPMMERYCSQLYDLNIRYRNLAASEENYQSRDISTEHDEIFEATIKRDSDTASAALISHYRLTGEYLTAQLSQL